MLVRDVAIVSDRDWLRRELAVVLQLRHDPVRVSCWPLTEALAGQRDVALILIDVVQLFEPLAAPLPPLVPSTVPMVVIGRAEDSQELLAAWSSGIPALTLEETRLPAMLEMLDKHPAFASLCSRKGSIISRQVHRLLKRRLARPELTASEEKVIDLLQQGYGNQAIARQLGRAEQTVKNLVSSAYSKLGLSVRHEAIAMSLDDWGRGTMDPARDQSRLRTVG